MEPRAGIEPTSPRYKGSASPQCLRGRLRGRLRGLDLNQGPLDHDSSALPCCATPRARCASALAVGQCPANRSRWPRARSIIAKVLGNATGLVPSILSAPAAAHSLIRLAVLTRAIW